MSLVMMFPDRTSHPNHLRLRDRTDSEEREPSDLESGPSANDPGKGVDSKRFDKETSEEEYEDPDPDSSVKHSSSSESDLGQSDSYDYCVYWIPLSE